MRRPRYRRFGRLRLGLTARVSAGADLLRGWRAGRNGGQREPRCRTDRARAARGLDRRLSARGDRDNRLAGALLAPSWIGVFDDDPATIQAGVQYLHDVGPFFGFFGLGFVLYV